VTEWEEDTGGSDWDNRVLYAGYRFDAERGLYHVRHRMYHATLGRWVQRDPAGYIDGLNLCQYGRSSPANWVDPAGLYCGECSPPSDPKNNYYHIQIKIVLTPRGVDPQSLDWNTPLATIGGIEVLNTAKSLGGGVAKGLAGGASKGVAFASSVAQTRVENAVSSATSGSFKEACLDGVETIKENSMKEGSWGNIGLGMFALIKYDACECCCPINPLLWGGEEDHEWAAHTATYRCVAGTDDPTKNLFGQGQYPDHAVAKQNAERCRKNALRNLRAGRL
jgi:RHS repeat-associated protein